jgi:hypothetical protein
MDPHDLYGLPLERFTPERNALAKRLRADGRRDEAARVAAMRKPSVGAWAVNQLVRSQRRAVKQLFTTGDVLRRVQSELLAGRGDAGKLLEAAKRERAAVDWLVETARGLLSSEGRELSQATLDRVGETLHAAALDDEARAEVEGGCLHQELRRVGLGEAGAVAAPPRTGRAARKASEPDPAVERERKERMQAARRAEADARRAAERARRGLEDAEQRRDRAAQLLEDAEARVRAARRRAEETAREHEAARRDLDRA